jgi:hypothetical protein
MVGHNIIFKDLETLFFSFCIKKLYASSDISEDVLVLNITLWISVLRENMTFTPLI